MKASERPLDFEPWCISENCYYNLFKGCRPCRRPRKNWQAVRTYIWYRPAPPQKKMGKGCSWDSFTRIVACYGFYVKGERAFLGVDVFCDVCCKTFLVKTFHPNLVDYFRGVSLIGSGFVEVVRVLKFSFIQLRFEKKGMYH